MRITHRHGKGLMPHELSHGPDVDARHDQPAGKGVSQAMPGEILQTGSGHRGLEPVARIPYATANEIGVSVPCAQLNERMQRA